MGFDLQIRPQLPPLFLSLCLRYDAKISTKCIVVIFVVIVCNLIELNTSDISSIWEPKGRKVRQLPRFKKLLREIGLVDYWNKFGWPDICHQLDNGDFKCE